MSIQVGYFDQNYGSITTDASGDSITSYKLGANRNPVISDSPQGINSENLYEIHLNLTDSGEAPTTYHEEETNPINIGGADGVLLVAFVGGKRRGTRIIYHGS